MISFRSITVLFVLGWISAGIVFVSGHAGVAQLGDTLESFVLYYLVWRCASCPKRSGATITLVLSDGRSAVAGAGVAPGVRVGV